MVKYLFEILILIFVGYQYSYAQISTQEINAISNLLEIEKEIHFLSIESPISLKEINRTSSYFSRLLNNDSSITKPKVKLISGIADILIYKFTTLGRTEYPWIRIFGIDSHKNVYILENEITFYNDLSKSISVQDSIKLLYLSEIFEKIYSLLNDAKIPASAKELPFYNTTVEKEYFKVNPINEGFMYRTFFIENTQLSTDYNIINLVLKHGKFEISRYLYKRTPK